MIVTHLSNQTRKKKKRKGTLTQEVIHITAKYTKKLSCQLKKKQEQGQRRT